MTGFPQARAAASMALGIGLVLTGCLVPKRQLEEALAERDDFAARLGTAERDLASMRTDKQRLEGELEAATAALARANDRLANKTAEAGELEADIAEMQTALRELEARRREAEASLEAFRDLVRRFQALIDAGTLQVKVVKGQMIVELATDILFAAGSANLSRDGSKALAEVADVLAGLSDRSFQVAGHTDDDPIRTERFPSNWHLGAARAIAVVQVLVDNGLDADRVSAASFAEYRPSDTNRTPEGKANNRRIEIIVVPDLSTLPGYDELEAIAEGD